MNTNVHEADITVGVPAWRGARTLAETLRSIQEQTYKNYVVLISIDGGDSDGDNIAAVCAPFLADHRFKLMRQTERLGWTGNLSLLMSICQTPYFCYWQQDDLASTDYLEKLHAAQIRHPDTSIAYTDLQWFGDRHGREIVPDGIGRRLERVLHQIESINFAPLRGLIRTSCLPEFPAICPAGIDDYHVETSFLAEMAYRGSFRRVTDALYFKRGHAKSAHGSIFSDLPGYIRCRTWILMGQELLRIACKCVAPEDKVRMLAIIMDRLFIVRPKRGFFFDPTNQARSLVRSFIASAQIEFSGPVEIDRSDPEWAAWPIDSEIVDALRDEARASRNRERISVDCSNDKSLTFFLSDGRPGIDLIGAGWSYPEPWGIWSASDRASLYVPGHVTEITLRGEAFGKKSELVKIGLQIDGNEAVFFEVEARTATELRIPVKSGSDRFRLLTVLTPDAKSPAKIGETNDGRHLGFGLVSITFTHE